MQSAHFIPRNLLVLSLYSQLLLLSLSTPTFFCPRSTESAEPAQVLPGSVNQMGLDQSPAE